MDGDKQERRWRCAYFITTFFPSILFIWRKVLQITRHFVDPLGLLEWLNLIRSFLCFFLRFWVWVLRHNMLLLNSMLWLFTVWIWRVGSRMSPFLRYRHSSELDSYDEDPGLEGNPRYSSWGEDQGVLIGIITWCISRYFLCSYRTYFLSCWGQYLASCLDSVYLSRVRVFTSISSTLSVSGSGFDLVSMMSQ